MKQVLLLTLTGFLGEAVLSSAALAQETVPKIRKAENCFPAGWISEKLGKFAELKPEKKDTVGVTPTAYLKLEDSSQPYPERYFIKDQGVETDLPIAPDGRLIGFEKLRYASEAVELCHYDPKRAGLAFDADGISLEINTDVQFHSKSGRHHLDEIKDGLKDGKSHYKKLAGALSIFVPKMSHVMIKYDDKNQPLKFVAMTGDVELTGTVEVVYCDLPMIKVKDLERIGADRLKILGGSYRLLPVPSLSAMKRFEGCDEDA